MKFYNIIKNASHYGDILAIPFFALLILYFYNIPEKSLIEYILFVFVIGGFVMDVLYTWQFMIRGSG